MIERKMKFWHWFSNESSFAMPSKWEEVVPSNNYISFECYKFRINRTVYRRNSRAFRIAYKKELMWKNLNG